MLCAFCPRTIWATLVGFCRNRQNCRRTKCTEHASKKIRSSKRLGLYIFQKNAKSTFRNSVLTKWGASMNTRPFATGCIYFKKRIFKTFKVQMSRCRPFKVQILPFKDRILAFKVQTFFAIPVTLKGIRHRRTPNKCPPSCL